MRKYILLLILIFLQFFFTACASKNYNNQGRIKQATLHPVSNGKTMMGVEIKNIAILQINGEEAGDSWNGVGGDEQVNSGKVNIFVRYQSQQVFASTTLIFNTVSEKTYDIQAKEVDEYVEFTVSLGEKIILKKKEKKQVVPPVKYQYIPIYI